MKLNELIAGLDLDSSEVSKLIAKNPDIKGVELDSRKVESGFIFVAISGYEQDGKKFVEDALKQGAVAVIVESKDGLSRSAEKVALKSKDVRVSLAEISNRLYGNPSKEILMIGITGTNGKTTCAHLVESILTSAGKKVLRMGTTGVSYLDFFEASPRTTQEANSIQKHLRQAISQGVDAAVIEVSSHALSLSRVLGLEFDGVLFANLDFDHQDFYDGLEPYFLAKKKLFEENIDSQKKRIAVANCDDEYGKRLLLESTIPIASFGIVSGEYDGGKLEVESSGIRGLVEGPISQKYEICSELTGDFNRYNILAATALCAELKFSRAVIESGINKLKYIPGRLQRVQTQHSIDVFVDFAHTGTGLRSVLKSLKSVCKNKLHVVFGAGGDKDPLRRKSMGEVAAEYADYSYITTDNPRSEDPKLIIESIYSAWSTKKDSISEERTALKIIDRESAVKSAVEEAQEGDIICLAGKGHETGQIIGDEILPYSDIEVVERALKQKSRF